MLLRSISKHVKDQNWFAVGLDFLIVVVGVFVGLQVSNWNSVQTDRDVAQDYLDRIQEELSVTIKNTPAEIEYTAWIKEAAIRALDSLGADTDNLGERFIVDAYVAGHGAIKTVQSETINELLSVGALSKISDTGLRQRILRHFQYLGGADLETTDKTTYQVDLRRAMPHAVLVLLRAKCSSETQVDKFGFQTFVWPEPYDPELTDKQILKTLTSLIQADLKSSLRQSVADLGSKHNVRQDIIAKSQTLYDFLQRHR